MNNRHIQDILNFGIGLFKAGEENLQSVFEQIQSAFNKLKEKGEQDASATAVRLHDFVSGAVAGLKDLSNQAEQNLSNLMKEAQNNYSHVLDQINHVIGEQRVRDLNTRVEQLADLVKNRTNEMISEAEKLTQQAGDTIKKATAKKTATEPAQKRKLSAETIQSASNGHTGVSP